jgi:predicted dithiol-disulfide oxidoreductase (DUF899 family)
MSEHTIGTREEWEAAREELAKLEADQAEQNQTVRRKRLELPWVPVEREYELETEAPAARAWPTSSTGPWFT